MKKGLLALLLLTACFSRASMMTRRTFEDLDLGSSVDLVVCEAGQPYSIHQLPGGKQEYEYIERINLGKKTVVENHYFLTIVDGQVVSKRIKTEEPHPYDILYEADPNYPTYRP